MLILIGLGLHNEEGMTLRGIHLAREADEVYLEQYTNKMFINKSNLDSLLHKEVKIVERRNLEEESEWIIEKSRNKKIALLIPGNVFIATTHIALQTEALQKGIEVKVEPGTSIYCAAIALTGLQIYKFGPAATIPLEGKSERIYTVLEQNKERGLHTFFFLDIKYEKNRFLTIPEALKKLLDLEMEKRRKVVLKNDLVIGLAHVGGEDSLIEVGSIEEVMKKNFGPPPQCLIYPGKLHFMEKEFLELIRERKVKKVQ